MKNHLPDLLKRYPVLEPCGQDLTSAFDMLVAAYRAGNKLLVCGNGGSAVDGEHLVAELMKGFLKRRQIPSSQVAQLEAVDSKEGKNVGARLQGALPAISLASPIALTTAIANDIGYEMIFAQQVHGLGRPGDVLLGISTSGKSKNVVNAMIAAKAFGLKTIALTGKAGGSLAAMVDVAIRVPADNVAEIQELHLPVYHWLSTQLEETFFAEGES